jgi:hypothetical protein
MDDLYKYNCIECNYKTNRKDNYNKHKLTKKHIKNTVQIPMIECPDYMCICGKKYVYSRGMERHQRNCKLFFESDNKNNQEQLIKAIENTNNEIKKLHETVNKQNSQISTLSQGNTIIHNTANITNNNKFNIQLFLNQECKNAKNLEELATSVSFTFDELESVPNIGLANSISNAVVTAINGMKLTERPIHCTDKKRATLYIKNGDKWSKDIDHQEMQKTIHMISQFQNCAFKKWIDENDTKLTWNEDLQNQYLKMSEHITYNYLKHRENVAKKVTNKVAEQTYLGETDELSIED